MPKTLPPYTTRVRLLNNNDYEAPVSGYAEPEPHYVYENRFPDPVYEKIVSPRKGSTTSTTSSQAELLDEREDQLPPFVTQGQLEKNKALKRSTLKPGNMQTMLSPKRRRKKTSPRRKKRTTKTSPRRKKRTTKRK